MQGTQPDKWKHADDFPVITKLTYSSNLSRYNLYKLGTSAAQFLRLGPASSVP